MIVKWKCDSALNIDTLCNSINGNTLSLKLTDFGYSNYKTNIEGGIFKF